MCIGWNRGGGRTRKVREHYEELVRRFERDGDGDGAPNNATFSVGHLLPRARKNARDWYINTHTIYWTTMTSIFGK